MLSSGCTKLFSGTANAESEFNASNSIIENSIAAEREIFLLAAYESILSINTGSIVRETIFFAESFVRVFFLVSVMLLCAALVGTLRKSRVPSL